VGAGSVNPMQDCRRPRRGACNVALGTARWDYASEAWPRGNALRPVRPRSGNGAAVWRRLRRACARRAGREACWSELRTSALASVPLPPRTTLVMRNRFLPEERMARRASSWATRRFPKGRRKAKRDTRHSAKNRSVARPSQALEVICLIRLAPGNACRARRKHGQCTQSKAALRDVLERGQGVELPAKPRQRTAPSRRQLRAGWQAGSETADDAGHAAESLDGGDYLGQRRVGGARACVLRRRVDHALQSEVERNLDRMGEIFRKPHVRWLFGLDLLGLLPGG
jgi:hypothetical protein